MNAWLVIGFEELNPRM